MRDLIRHILREELILEMPKKSNTEDFIRRAKEIHGDKYDYTPTNYVNTSTKVEINCPKHGEFYQNPNAHLRGQGCSKCGDLNAKEKRTKPTKNLINQFKTVHGDFYDYSQVEYVNSHTKVKITCPIHGEFSQNPSNHIQGQGCPKCGFEKTTLAKKEKFIKDFVNRAEKIHGKFYDYSQLDIVNSGTKIKIICPIHGEFLQTPNEHLQGSGCNKCGQERTADSRRIPKEEIIQKAKEVHGDKYDYSEIVFNTIHDKVNIICPKHGMFSQSLVHHIHSKSGCPICSESKGVKLISKVLKKYNIPYVREKKFKDCVNTNTVGRYCRQLPFDIYIPSQNTIIEYDGKQHYEPIKHFGGEEQFQKQQRLDQIKNDYCRDNGIKLIRIPYTIKDTDIETLLRDESVI